MAAYRVAQRSRPVPPAQSVGEFISTPPTAEVDELAQAIVPPGTEPSQLPREQSYVVPNRAATAVPAQAFPADEILPAESVLSQQLITDLARPFDEGLTPERAAYYKQQLQLLASQGTAAVPAIRQFLDRNQDLSLDEPGGAQLVGYTSLRAGLLDLLGQMGGPEATETLVSTLRNTAEPHEIALIGRFLEERAPGQFRGEVVAAARETLQQAAQGGFQLREAGPLFQVLQNYGDGAVAADLARSMPQWHYYANMALAGLPDGQGIPALRQRVEESGRAGRNDHGFALQMLAQLSPQHPDAAAALIEQARANQIPERAWNKVVEGLTGDQYQLEKPPPDAAANGLSLPGLKTYHIESGNQNFYSLPFGLYGSPEQAAQRRAVIDQLLAATRNPTAVQALENARAALPTASP